MANTIPYELGTLTLYRGTKKTFEFLIKDDAGATIDLSAPPQTLVLTLRTNEYQADPPTLTVTLSHDADQSAGGNRGLTTASFTAAQTTTLNAGTYVIDIFRTNTGDEDIYARGKMLVKNSINIEGKRA